MKYEKPTVDPIGNARALVFGTKGLEPVPDNDPKYLIQSPAAYQADE